MNSSVIGKIEKAKRYAEEKGRVTFNSFVADFKGENDDHRLEYHEGTLVCSCLFFVGHSFCSHSMALQRILEDMLPV
ncbi:MAG: hypothetical protein QGI09_09045 [Dehalococcoidia bacterium]|nr:hypothetical protein [Dehalococcoidia bacterium]MDP6495544.1 hypothetical protein [Dehalococcoidia bacterium]